MASTIIKFPDGRVKEGTKIVTAYHEVNGIDYMITDTEEFDGNNNKIVGVSYKPVGEDRFRNIIDIEEWKKAKGFLVNDLHDEKNGFDYLSINGEELVTEDYKHNLALKSENYDKLVLNYENYLNTKNASVPSEGENKPVEVIDFPKEMVMDTQNTIVNDINMNPEPLNNEPIAPAINTPIINKPTLVPVPTPEPEQQPIIAPTTAPDLNNIVEFPSSANMDITLDAPVIEQPKVETPIIAEEQVATGVFAPANENINKVVEQTNTNNINTSSVANYYTNTMNTLVAELNDITDKYKELTDKVQNTVMEISGKVVDLLVEINERDELSKQTFEKSQAILASQSNNDVVRDLTKAA